MKAHPYTWNDPRLVGSPLIRPSAYALSRFKNSFQVIPWEAARQAGTVKVVKEVAIRTLLVTLLPLFLILASPFALLGAGANLAEQMIRKPQAPEKPGPFASESLDSLISVCVLPGDLLSAIRGPQNPVIGLTGSWHIRVRLNCPSSRVAQVDERTLKSYSADQIREWAEERGIWALHVSGGSEQLVVPLQPDLFTYDETQRWHQATALTLEDALKPVTERRSKH
jgi:hypothetical protein